MSQEFYDQFIDIHLKTKYSKPNSHIRYAIGDVLTVVASAKEVFKKQATLIEINPPVVFVGDIHGQFRDLQRIFAMFDTRERSGCRSERFLFLGDYVDRGTHSLECIMLLLLLKLRFPKCYNLLRGNHECDMVSRQYGFHAELLDRFPPIEAHNMFDAFTDLFSFMPLAALVGKKILAMHGGIGSWLKSLDDIREIKRPIFEPLHHREAAELLWSDPMVGLKGFCPNDVRGVAVFFGEDAVTEVCERLKIDLIVRAHQVMINGYAFFCNRKLVTIFSAPYYNTAEKVNRAAVLHLTKDGQISVRVLIPNDAKKAEPDIKQRPPVDDHDYCSFDSLREKSLELSGKLGLKKQDDNYTKIRAERLSRARSQTKSQLKNLAKSQTPTVKSPKTNSVTKSITDTK